MSIAVQWVVLAELSTDAMIATGMTDDPSAARWIVETIMADVRNAGWGEVLRVPVPGEAPTETELTAWPPPGEVWVCRRTSHDGFTWMPLFCAEPDTAKQRRVRQASPERDFEHGFDRQQHDQRVERVPAGERPEALHASNVLHAPAHRLLRK